MWQSLPWWNKSHSYKKKKIKIAIWSIRITMDTVCHSVSLTQFVISWVWLITVEVCIGARSIELLNCFFLINTHRATGWNFCASLSYKKDLYNNTNCFSGQIYPGKKSKYYSKEFRSLSIMYFPVTNACITSTVKIINRLVFNTWYIFYFTICKIGNIK